MENSKKNYSLVTSNSKCTYYNLFYIFLFSSVIGVIVETIWCILITHTISSRTGLVIGYFNPIYGIGALLMTFIYMKFKDKNIFIIFIICMILGGGFEFLCSLIQEKIFGTVSWYYDADSLGILGKRTSIIYCILWGILGIIWIKKLYKIIEKYIEKIPKKIGKTFAFLFTIFLVFDITLSSLAVYRQKERRHNIPADNKIRIFLDNNYNDEKLSNIYPNMTIKQ